MENKEDLVNRLLKEGKINFKEACVLMDMQSNVNIQFVQPKPDPAIGVERDWTGRPFSEMSTVIC